MSDDNATATVTAPYHERYVGEIKYFPDAEYDADARSWTVPVTYLDDLVALLEECFGEGIVNAGR